MTTRLGSAVGRVVLALTCLGCAPALASEPATAAGASTTPTTPLTTPAPRRYAPRRAAGQGIEQRVRLLTKGLGLDARQQSELRRILEGQQEQMRRAWGNPAIPADERVAVTRAILERTRERIRGILNEEQRKKYPGPRAPGAPRPQQPDVESWMRLTQGHPTDGGTRRN